jgi:hypothetical protein
MTIRQREKKSVKIKLKIMEILKLYVKTYKRIFNHNHFYQHLLKDI